jgi:predicted carbohydrate-binding protein with CBM5 and CBM33 domain
MQILLLGLLVSGADAHGYTTISRNYKCTEGSNYDCGSIRYEPQSLEAPKGFPDFGPPDEHLASAGHAAFDELDVQDPYRWMKTNVQTGPFAISWHFTANHVSTGWQYFLTKQDWNPSAPISRSSFDLEPFCTVDGGGNKPPFDITHTCNLPARTGYQVILAVWTVGDTAAAFYNMNDVLFDGVTTTGPPVTVSPTTNLRPPTKAPTNAPTKAPTSSTQAPTNLGAPTNAPTKAPTGTGTGPVCSSGRPLEAVDQCTAFVYCENDAELANSKQLCPAGLLFNNDAQVCDWPDNVDCV